MLQALPKVGSTSDTSYNPDNVMYVPGQQRPMNAYLTPELNKVYAIYLKLPTLTEITCKIRSDFAASHVLSPQLFFSKPWHNFIA